MDAVQNQLGSRHCGILLHRKLPLYVGLSSVLLATLLIVPHLPGLRPNLRRERHNCRRVPSGWITAPSILIQ